MFIDKFIVWNATDILVDGESQRLFLIQNNIRNVFEKVIKLESK
jgi:hypothetical protein